MKRRYFRPETLDGQLDIESFELALDLGAQIDEDRCELFINENVDPLEFLSVFNDNSVPPLEHECILKKEGNVIWLRKFTSVKSLDVGVTLAATNIYLDCPKAEEDECKSEGGKWDDRKKQWYVPEGIPIKPFWRWVSSD